MSNNLHLPTLALRAMEDFEQLLESQLLIEMCLDELQDPSKGSQKAGLLLEVYRSRMTLHTDELRVGLRSILRETVAQHNE